MREETNNTVAYLLALKRYREGSTESAPGEEGSAAARQPEKRRSPRYTCQGSVELREQESDVRSCAKVTDLSLHGCYVEMTATYAVGTKLHMKLDVSGYQIRANGTVRVTYPLLGMGVAFTPDSAEDHSRLRQLLYILTEPFSMQSPASLTPRAAKAPTAEEHSVLLRELQAFFQTRPMMTREEFEFLVRKTRTL
jgi:hypothetical protein